LQVEIDNLAYQLLVPEHTRARLEAVGRVQLSIAEAGNLHMHKKIHVLLLAAVLAAAIPGLYYARTSIFSSAMVFPFTFGAVLDEVYLPAELAAKQPALGKRVAKALGKGFVGLVGCMLTLFAYKAGTDFCQRCG
jgi:hypothetical protein